MLAAVARSVVACDRDPAALAGSDRHPNLRLIVGDAQVLPVASASVDVLVCFDALGRGADPGVLLSEIRRVLRFGGLLLLGADDSAIAPAPPHGLTRDALLALAASRFAHVALGRQQAMAGSLLLPEAAAGTRLVFERRPDGSYAAASGLAAAPFMLCLASDQELPPLPVSVLVLHGDLDAAARAVQARDAEIARMTGRLAAVTDARDAAVRTLQARDAALARVTAASEAASAQLAAARAQVAALTEAGDAAQAATRGMRSELRAALARAEAQATAERAAREAAEADLQRVNDTLAATRTRELATEDRLAAIEGSRSWRATGWLRRFGSNHPGLARQVRRTMLIAEWTRRGELATRLSAWRRRRPMLALPAPVAPLALPAGLALPSAEAPDVSVIIPCFGRADVTLRCLVALAASAPRCALEVLVAEDASGDPAVEALAAIPGLRLLHNPANLGFLRNCNAAAAQARGRYLLFLNNDTEVRPGAIDALLELAEARPDAGLVGARLVYPDGRLQEAGGVLWSDGSGWNVGHDGDPAASEFNYVREVDYCSAAALLVPAALFAALGGFDEAFAPAYCEDSDLAFRVRAAGRKVLYQPRAVVVHHEGVSHGSDVGSGIKAYQETNRQTLRERWGEVLRTQHLPRGSDTMRARDRARGRPICLVIDHYVPEPDRDAGSGSIAAMMRTLQEANGVVKFWPDNQAATEPYTETLRQQGVEVICGPPPVSFARWIAAHGAALDHVLLSRPTVAPSYLPLLARHAPQAALSFYGHDLHAVRMRREAALTGDAVLAAAAEAMERTERTVWQAVDVVIYPSEVEAETVRRLEPAVVAHAVTPYRYEVPPPRDAPVEGAELLFVAGFAHTPNLDAADWLVRAILPLVREAVPEARLALVGSNPTDAVLALAGDGVEVTGSVSTDELSRRYRSARVAVVPLRVGAGVKAKVVEALCTGLPLVTTSIGAEGLPGLADIVTVADEPAAIAAALVRLLRDDDAWLAASRAQSVYAAEHFGYERMRDTLLDALADAARVREARQAEPPRDPG